MPLTSASLSLRLRPRDPRPSSASLRAGQDIEEGFILDLLRNYTTYKLAFRLASEGKEFDETEVERAAALNGIMRWVRLHPFNISRKVQIVVEHFLGNVQPLLNGHAKPPSPLASEMEDRKRNHFDMSPASFPAFTRLLGVLGDLA